MTRNCFTVFDLIYFIGEKLKKHSGTGGVHKIDGDSMLAVTFYNLLLGLLASVNNVYPLKGSPNWIVLFFIVVLPYSVSWLVYHKFGRHGRVMAHYRGSVYDSGFICCLMLFMMLLVPWVFPLFIIT